MPDSRPSWPNAGRLALSMVVNVEEGAEQSIADGDRGPDPVDELGIVLRKSVRNFGNESNYQYGIKEGARRVLDLLAEFDVPATFTAAAVALERAPTLAAALRDSGHEICAHGYRWQAQMGMNEAEERTFIMSAIESIERSVGRRPRGWLSRYLHTANTRRLLSELDFLYHMDDYSADEPFWEDVNGRPLVIMPYALDTNDMKMWNAPALTPRHWLDYLVDSFDVLYREGFARPRMMSVGVHLRIIGRPGRIGALRQFLDYARSKSGVWFATRASIAEHFAAHNQSPSGPLEKR